MDSIPMVIITGQVSRAAIGSDAFQKPIFMVLLSRLLNIPMWLEMPGK